MNRFKQTQEYIPDNQQQLSKRVSTIQQPSNPIQRSVSPNFRKSIDVQQNLSNDLKYKQTVQNNSTFNDMSTDNLISRIKNLQHENNNLKQTQSNFEQNRVSDLHIQIQTLQQQKEKISKELTQITSQFEDLNTQNQLQKKLIDNLSKDVEKEQKLKMALNQQNQQKDQELRSYKEKVSSKDFVSMSKDDKEFQNFKSIEVLKNQNSELSQKYNYLRNLLQNQLGFVKDDYSFEEKLNQKLRELSENTTKCSIFETQIKKLREKEEKFNLTFVKLEDAQSEIDKLQKEIKTANIELKRWISLASNEGDDSKKKRQMLEKEQDKVLQLEAQLQQKNANVQLLQKKLDDLNAKYTQLNDQYRHLQQQGIEIEKINKQEKDLQQREILRVTEVMTNRMVEVDEWRSQYYHLDRQLEILRNNEVKLKEAELNTDNLRQENNRITQQYKLKNDELKDLKQQFTSLQVVMNDVQQNNILYLEEKNRRVFLESEVQRLQNILQGRLDEIEAWKSRLSQFENRFSRNDAYGHEIQNLRKNLEEKFREVELWKTKHSQLEQLRLENRSQIEEQIEQITYLNNQNKNLAEKMEQQVKYAANAEEQKNQNIVSLHKLEVLSSEIDRQNDVIMENERELQQYRNQQQSDIELRQKLLIYEQNQVLMSMENESLKKQIKQIYPDRFSPSPRKAY